MSIINVLEDENSKISYDQLVEVEAGVIDEDQISQWQQASPQDLSWLPED
jgi:hypothetical protein